ncbi:hypothetical protein [Brachybacterium tyrofermentans]|uniref:hypothetical protein n=1 Tax=Brachybacterium tyrofermentans TaxID=47848 RepID=UPI003FCF59F3
MRWRTALSTTAAVGLLSMGIALPAHGALTTYCLGTAADVTVPGDLVVRADQSCDLSGVTVTGNVTVRAGADLIAQGSTFDGNLRVQEDAYLDAKGSTIAGKLVLRSAYGAYVEDGAVAGRTDAQESGFLYSLGSEHSARIVAASGETYLDGSVVRGDVITTDEHLTDVYDSWITGDLSVTDAAEGGLLCTSEVDGDLSYAGSGGVVQISAGAPVGPCGVSYVGGDVALTDNTDGVLISSTIVRGDLRCDGNDPAPTGTDNRVRGASEGQCAELAAPADTSGGARLAPQQVDDRRDGVLEKAGARAAEGEREAAAAGSARIGG